MASHKYPWDQLEAQIAFREARRLKRVRPASGVRDVMGEIRSMIHDSWTGEERWEEWRGLIEGQEVHEQRVVFEYLSAHWSWRPIETLDEARVAFGFCAMSACKKALSDAGLWFAPEVASLAAVEAWEAKQGALPFSLKRYLCEITAGDAQPEEQMYFLFDPECEHAEFNLFMTAQEMLRDEEIWFGEDQDEALIYEAIGRALERHAMEPTAGAWSVETLMQGAPACASTLEAVQRALLVACFVEGNHGDDSVFTIRDGEYCEQLVHYDLLFHGSVNDGSIRITSADDIRRGCLGGLGDWLVYLFYTHVVGYE